MKQKITFDVTIGETPITVEAEVETDTDVFKIMDFWHSIPKVGPNEATDLLFKYRTTPRGGFEYFEILCPSQDVKFQFGQIKKSDGKLFPKDWVPLNYRDEEEAGSTQLSNEQALNQAVEQQLSNAAKSGQNNRQTEQPGQKAPNNKTPNNTTSITDHTDDQLKKALAFFGATDPGKEKMLVKNTLGLKSGKLVSELSAQERATLLQNLRAKRDQAGQKTGTNNK